MRSFWRTTRGALGALILVVTVLGAAPVGAQASGEQITSYAVDITVQADGGLAVHETIAYDFGDHLRHGIIRAIPVRSHYDSRHDRVEPVSHLSVRASAGTPTRVATEHAGGYERIRIGDPNRTITGVHTYELDYRVDGALNGFRDHVELYWNAVGDEWTVPIRQATVRVGAPATIGRVTCFAGPAGSRLTCKQASADGDVARFADADLDVGSGLTVVVSLPLGAVPTPRPILRERWSADRAFARTPATLAGAGVLLVAVVGGLVALLWRTGRDRRFVGSAVDVAFGNETGADRAVSLLERTEIPVEYAPPDGLRPGQVGTLIDEVANPLDVTATIVDLAARGYLRIEEVPKDGWFSKADWRLVRADADDSKLLTYERTVYDALFEDRRPAVELSSLRNHFASTLHKVQDELYDDSVARGWFARRPDRTRAFWTAVGIGALVVAGVVEVAVAAKTHAGLVPIPLLVAALVLVAGAHKMPRRTAKGTGALRRVLGFRRFIAESEQDRARFAERQNLFSEYLPYAVVFGCTEKWAKAFAGLGQEPPQPSWYVSPNPFSVVAFGHAVDGFSVATAGTLVATPGTSGASGFGGGGFSGGGGGGGGGGSW